ncbi:MAG: hypothetical protein ACFE9L_14265 [Candidatus Hodarchaeota archaeon]
MFGGIVDNCPTDGWFMCGSIIDGIFGGNDEKKKPKHADRMRNFSSFEIPVS